MIPTVELQRRTCYVADKNNRLDCKSLTVILEEFCCNITCLLQSYDIFIKMYHKYDFDAAIFSVFW